MSKGPECVNHVRMFTSGPISFWSPLIMSDIYTPINTMNNFHYYLFSSVTFVQPQISNRKTNIIILTSLIIDFVPIFGYLMCARGSFSFWLASYLQEKHAQFSLVKVRTGTLIISFIIFIFNLFHMIKRTCSIIYILYPTLGIRTKLQFSQ